jgi:polysaccharide biosynthesis transport protein
MEHASPEVRGLSDYVRVVRRRKWLIVAVTALLCAASLLYSLGRDPLYRASSEVLLDRTTLVADITGAVESSPNQQPDRVAKTEAAVAAVPAVADRVLKATGVTDMTPEQFLAHSSATARADADLLVLSVDADTPERAAALAAAYGREFTAYRKELDTAALQRAHGSLLTQIAEVRKSRNKEQLSELLSQAQQLETAEALATGNTTVIREPTTAEATKVRPRPLRDVLLAAGAGLLLGIVVAFLRDALDTRIRSADEIATRLGLPLLARIPEPPRALQVADRLVMLAEPNGTDAEAFRMLRTNLDFVNLERSARTIMVTSASEREGKSTTAANLAIALARAGKNVVLVDLDLRRPFLHAFFDLEREPGLTHVVLDQATLEQATSKVWEGEASGHEAAPAKAGQRTSTAQKRTSTAQRRSTRDSEGNGRRPLGGFLEVIPSGGFPPNPGEFVATHALENVLARLRDQADFVLIDAPPLIGIGDALTISAKVDGIIVVTRVNRLRRPMLGELHRLLGTSPAQALGFVVTGAEAEEDRYGYGFDGYYTVPPPRGRREGASAPPADQSQSPARKRRRSGRVSRAARK